MADDLDATRAPAHELLAAYALDAVDDSERSSVEQLVADDPAARRELDEYREVVATFTSDERPPAALRDQVLAQVAAQSVRPPAQPPHHAAPSTPVRTSHRRGRPLRRRLAALGAAAAVVVAVAVPTTIAIQSVSSQRELEAQADTIAQMLADPDARILTADMDGGGEVSALVSSGHVMLSASGMADPGQDQDYQLWAIDGDVIRSAGLIRPTGGSASALIAAAPGTTLAVTLEPAGGSAQPTSDPLVAVQT